MKRIVSLILVSVLLAALCSTALAAINTQYSSTRLFLDSLDEYGLKYTYVGVDSDGDEKITLKYSDSDLDLSYTINYYFEENNENAIMRVWNLVTFDEGAENLIKALIACNKCHQDWKYVTFTVEPDNSITASMDLIYRGESVGDVMVEATVHMMSIIEKAYTTYLAELQTDSSK